MFVMNAIRFRVPCLACRTARAGQAARRIGSGFTLLELLVAMCILAMLVLFVGQIIDLTGQSISINSKKLDADRQVRMALDMIGADVGSRLKRSDVGHGFTKQEGNDSLGLYSEVDNYGGDRRVTAVGYRIREDAASAGQAYQLLRGVKGTAWDGDQGVRFSQAFPTISDTDYEVLADSILRMEFAYMKTDGSFSNTAKPDLSDVAAIVVAVAVLDQSSRKQVDEGKLAALVNALPDVANGEDPLTGWNRAMASSSFTSQFPGPIVQSLRLAQRYFYVY